TATGVSRAAGGWRRRVAGGGVDSAPAGRAPGRGAGVLVAPAARAHWRAEEPVPDERTRERHRLRTVLASYSRWHLLRVLPQYVVVTIVEVVASVVTGRFRRAGALLSAEPGAPPHPRRLPRKAPDQHGVSAGGRPRDPAAPTPG